MRLALRGVSKILGSEDNGEEPMQAVDHVSLEVKVRFNSAHCFFPSRGDLNTDGWNEMVEYGSIDVRH